MEQSKDAFNMVYSEWQSMVSVWESTLPLKITVHNLAMPRITVDNSHGSASGDEQQLPSSLFQSPMLSSSSVRSTPFGGRINGKGLMANRSRASSDASSFMAATLLSSYPSTPRMLPTSRPFPLSMFHLLNQSNDSVSIGGGMLSPDNRFIMHKNEDPLFSQWNDEAIAAVTMEVLNDSGSELHSPFNAASTTSNQEVDPMISDYTKWLVSASNTPTDADLSLHSSSVLSALSLIDNPNVTNEQLVSGYNNVDMITLMSGIASNNSSSMVQGDGDLAAANLLFASMISNDASTSSSALARKRNRSHTLSSMSSTKSAKRFQPYPLSCKSSSLVV